MERDKSWHISDKREANTGVAIVEHRSDRTGIVAELKEINSYLEGEMPLNKTERERLRKRAQRIEDMLKGMNPTFSTLGRQGQVPKEKMDIYQMKKSVINIIKQLNKNGEWR